MPDEYQKEFFTEFKKEKGAIKKIRDKLTKRHENLFIYLGLENIIFILIICIMCIVVAFALGVERGKRLTRSVQSEERVPSSSREKGIRMPPVEVKSAGAEKAGAKAGPVSTEKIMQIEDKPYTIQLISYKQKDRAERERDNLLNKKIEAFLIPSGEWYQVCAGGYGNMKEAKAALKEFSKEYKGCFVRKSQH